MQRRASADDVVAFEGRNELGKSNGGVDQTDYIMRRKRAQKLVGMHKNADRWRVTCNMNMANDAPDVAEAKWSDFNIFKYSAAKCMKMTLMRIRVDKGGGACKNCYAKWWQFLNEAIHMDSSPANQKCSAPALSIDQSIRSEDNFGSFGISVSSTLHTCSRAGDSTTNWWARG